jgi:hypothetical protein
MQPKSILRLISLLAIFAALCGCCSAADRTSGKTGHHVEDAFPREYDLGRLMGLKHKQPAPPSIVAAIVAREKAGLKEDKVMHPWASDEDLLAVLPLDLNSDGIQDFLVYPRRYLLTFCGAHSVACWLFKGGKDGKHRLVLSGRQDAVRIMKTKTNGMRDIELVYWSAMEEVRTFHYDGKKYKEVSYTKKERAF